MTEFSEFNVADYLDNKEVLEEYLKLKDERIAELEEFQQGAFNEIFHWSSECEKHEVRISELEVENKKLIELYSEAFEEVKRIKASFMWIVSDSVCKVLGWIK